MSDYKEMYDEKNSFDVKGGDGSGGKKGFNYSLLYKIPLGVIILILLGIYFLTGFYIVQPEEVGVVTRFGKFSTMTDPGLHYRLPFPIEEVKIINVTDARRIEIGYRTIQAGPNPRYRDEPGEALMLTGDLSIVNVEATVLYKIINAADYIFKVQNPNGTVKDAAEAALRQIVGQNSIDSILTTKKAEIQIATRDLLQDILDQYQTGILVEGFFLQGVSVPTQVQQAYRDVASAKEDKQKKINDAEAYRNQIIPKARGEAYRIINEAEAYKATRVAQAEGEVARFEELLTRYKMGEDVTRIRLYLETMETIMPKVNKVIVPEGDDGLLKLLNLNQEKGGNR